MGLAAWFVYSPVKEATPTDSFFKDLTTRTLLEKPSPGTHPSNLGALLWIAHCVRADVAFAVNRLSQFLCDPYEAHWSAAVRILNYLLSTKSLQLKLGGDLSCSGYSDLDWAQDKLTRHLTLGYTYRIGVGAISWKSRKHKTVSLSSTKAEYKAVSDLPKEALWLKHLLTELHLQPQDLIPLHVGNEGAKALAQRSRPKPLSSRFYKTYTCLVPFHLRMYWSGCHKSIARLHQGYASGYSN